MILDLKPLLLRMVHAAMPQLICRFIVFGLFCIDLCFHPFACFKLTLFNIILLLIVQHLSALLQYTLTIFTL